MSRTAARQQVSVEKRARNASRAGTKAALRGALLGWYDAHARDLPWRVGPGAGQRADPYRVWLSEIMLQQTTVAAVGPYFARFCALFPDVHALANAPRDDVLSAWAGLGYYSRARNLHAAAQALSRDGFPASEEGWRALPGVGPYTAAAISAIALDLPANVVDGNVERVMARFYAVEAPLPAAKNELRERAGALVDAHRPGDWAQALMDLGATICTPTSPNCLICPVREFCAAFAGGAPETYPRKTPKAERPKRYGAVFVARRGDAVLTVRRADKGLLGGMLGLPTTEWGDAPLPRDAALAHAPFAGDWTQAGQVRHVFTHFALTLDVFVLDLGDGANDAAWVRDPALPTVFKKALALR